MWCLNYARYFQAPEAKLEHFTVHDDCIELNVFHPEVFSKAK
jgi:carboxylesterase type B